MWRVNLLICIFSFFLSVTSCSQSNKNQDLINDPEKTFQIIDQKFPDHPLFKDINTYIDQSQYVLQIMVYEKGKLQEYRYQNNIWSKYASVDFSIEGNAQLTDFLFSLDTNFTHSFSKKIAELHHNYSKQSFQLLSWQITSPDHSSSGKKVIYKITYKLNNTEYTINN